MNDFVHLHVHSEYSLLDGYASTKAIAQRAADLGMGSIALTDHGVMYGAVEFYEAAQKAGIKPIIGVEAYIASGDHTERAGGYYHLLLLAKNEQGYRNLVRLTTHAHLDGFYRKPRIDRALLEQHREGLIVTSACLAGEVAQAIEQDDKHKAREIAEWYKGVFGEDFFLELQLHDNTPQLEPINDELVRIGGELGIELVVTNDTHYIQPSDLEMHNHILAMGYGITLDELCSKGRNFDGTYHIASGEEMWHRFKRYGTAPLENTRRIADLCNLNLTFGRVQLPAFEIPDGFNAETYLRHLCFEGLNRRFNNAPPSGYEERLDYELNVINQTGFPDYMLIVWDYVKYARTRGIPCLPRGSAGASLVLYCLGITDVDPVANKLLFERFLSLERLEMPDIDTDFADSRRHEVIEYMMEKYGRDNTAQIITYGTLGAKAALRDIGRVMGLPLNEVDQVARLIPALPVGTTIAQALERVPQLRQIYDSDERMRDLLERAQKVEGRMRSFGTHACGVVVSRDPLADLVPLQRTTRDEQSVMAAYEGNTLAKIGLLKMDILGLANLSIVAQALEYIAATTGKRMQLEDIPLTDPHTFAGLSEGHTVAVFQLESAGMTRYLKELKPTRVEDLYAMVALYRPGPLEQIPHYIRNKNNPHQISYLHPILKPILEDTYGIIVYQEQIMQLLQAIAGYTLGRAYIVLKAIGKKKRDLMAQEEPIFKEGCVKNGLTRDQADHLWDLIQPFAGYSFNRPHSTLYGLLSYQTAYLKFNYPAQYMAAVLSSAAGSTSDVAKGVSEAARLGVPIYPPDINASGADFTFEKLPDQDGYAIRFGLAAIKNVGHAPVEAILAARNEGGKFESLEDLCARVEHAALNKRVLESLIKCGALDDLKGNRHQKLAILDAAIQSGLQAQKARESGQVSLFDLFGAQASATPTVSAIPLPVVKITPQLKKEELAWEKDLLGMYISDHPLQVLDRLNLDPNQYLPLDALSEHIGKGVTVIGMLSRSRTATTKKGERMLIAVLEDHQHEIEVVAFPKAYEKLNDVLADDRVLRVHGKVEHRRDTLQLVIEAAEDLEQIAAALPETPDETELVQIEHEQTDAMNDEEATPAPTEQRTEAAAATVPALMPEPTPAAPTPLKSAPAPEIPVAAANTRTIRTPNRVSLAAKESGASYTTGNGHTGANGNGNGHTGPNGNGFNASGNGPAASPASPPHSGRVLHLKLPTSPDVEHDIRRMQDIDDLLRACEGGDQVLLYLPNGVGTLVFQPHYRVHASPDLMRQLVPLVGDGNVSLAP